jgi:hypothetical protein
VFTLGLFRSNDFSKQEFQACTLGANFTSGILFSHSVCNFDDHLPNQSIHPSRQPRQTVECYHVVRISRRDPKKASDGINNMAEYVSQRLNDVSWRSESHQLRDDPPQPVLLSVTLRGSLRRPPGVLIGPSW